MIGIDWTYLVDLPNLAGVASEERSLGLLDANDQLKPLYSAFQDARPLNELARILAERG